MTVAPAQAWPRAKETPLCVCIAACKADAKTLQLQQLGVLLTAPLYGPAETTQLGVSQALCSAKHFVPVHSEEEVLPLHTSFYRDASYRKDSRA